MLPKVLLRLWLKVQLQQKPCESLRSHRCRVSLTRRLTVAPLRMRALPSVVYPVSGASMLYNAANQQPDGLQYSE